MSAQLLAALGNVLFVGAVLTISIRLLWLWRRTREWPELLISSGLLVLSLVGFPLLAVSGLAEKTIAEVNSTILAAGLVALASSVVLLQAFTWRTFRPRSSAALAFVVATAVAAFVVAGLFHHAVVTAQPHLDPVAVHSPYSLGVRLLFEVWYAWMGFESLLEWSRARRRLALGLSDPVVVNRFLLWGSMGVVLAFNGAVAMMLEAQGLSPMVDALPAIWLGMNGTVAGVLMFLTFVPPAGYVRWVRRHHDTALG